MNKSAYKCLDPAMGRIYVSRHVTFVVNEFPYPSLIRSQRNSPTTTLAVEPPHLTIHHALSPIFQQPVTHTNPIPVFDSASPVSSPIRCPGTVVFNPGEPSPRLSNDTSHEMASEGMELSSLPARSEQTRAKSAPVHESPVDATAESSKPLAASTSSTASVEVAQPVPASRPQRHRRPNPKYYNESFVNITTAHLVTSSIEPRIASQALKNELWRAAMIDEYDALMRNSMWELVPRPNRDIVGYKWIFTVKRKADGSVDRFKARLVARGFLQEPGRDYFETFSPVVKPVIVWVILTVTLSKGWSLRQLDVNDAFINGTLSEEVYMEQQAGFMDKNLPGFVCRLRKAIYKLKQAPRAWYSELSKFLVSFGFWKSVADSSLFIYCNRGLTLFFLVYVDDIILIGSSDVFIKEFVYQLAQHF